MSTNIEKCNALKQNLIFTDMDYPYVSIERFFDGNDDCGSIGCNLLDHPGIGVFKQVLSSLENRTDVDAVFVVITEADPSEKIWAFSDYVIVIGKITREDLKKHLEPIKPDAIELAKVFGIGSSLQNKYHNPILAAWWD